MDYGLYSRETGRKIGEIDIVVNKLNGNTIEEFILYTKWSLTPKANLYNPTNLRDAILKVSECSRLVRYKDEDFAIIGYKYPPVGRTKSYSEDLGEFFQETIGFTKDRQLIREDYINLNFNWTLPPETLPWLTGKLSWVPTGDDEVLVIKTKDDELRLIGYNNYNYYLSERGYTRCLLAENNPLNLDRHSQLLAILDDKIINRAHLVDILKTD